MLVWLVSPLGIFALAFIVSAAILSRIRYGWRVPAAIVVLGAGTPMGCYQIVSIPLPASVGLPSPAQVYDVHGRLIGTYSNVRRFIIDTNELPEFVRHAVIAAEDHDFYSHRGLSMKGMLRAARTNLTSLRIAQGGSTIDQQYVKIAVLHDGARTITRKVKEAVLAVKLNQTYSKEQILDFYLNTVYLGRGAYGIEAAARTYFGHNATELTLAKAAFIAGLIRAPEAYQPDERPLDGRGRRDSVLLAMADEGCVSRSRARRLMDRPLRFTPGLKQRASRQEAAYFMEWLRRGYLAEEFGDCLYTCGLKIYTTLDLDMQEDAETAVANHLDNLDDPQAALVAMTPAGEVRALVGGREFDDAVAASGFNFASDPPGRHAGSALKPFTLLAALKDGYSPATLVSGHSPRTISSSRCRSQDRPWRVENSGGVSYGTMTLDRATASSVNTAYAGLIETIGPVNVARLLSDMGFARAGDAQRAISGYCSLALGSLDVTPLEMTRAYAGFAGKGVVPSVTPIVRIDDATGTCMETKSLVQTGCDQEDVTEAVRVAGTQIATTLNVTLTHVIESGTGTRADIGRPAAGKTGTSQNHSDAWFAGYVPQLASVVWMGYPQEQPSGIVPQMRSCRNPKICRPVDGENVTGGTIPASIWADFMERVTARFRIADFTPPAASGQGGPAETGATWARDDVEEPTEGEDDPVPAPEPSPSGGGRLLPLPLPIPTPPG